MDFERLIEISRALKGKNQTGRAFHTTFCFRKNKMLAIGINNYSKTHPLTSSYLPRKNNNKKTFVPVIHSEISGIIKLGFDDCSDITFVNIRIDNNDMPNMARPCLGCLDVLMNQVGYKRLFYTYYDGSIKELFLNE